MGVGASIAIDGPAVAAAEVSSRPACPGRGGCGLSRFDGVRPTEMAGGCDLSALSAVVDSPC